MRQSWGGNYVDPKPLGGWETCFPDQRSNRKGLYMFRKRHDAKQQQHRVIQHTTDRHTGTDSLVCLWSAPAPSECCYYWHGSSRRPRHRKETWKVKRGQKQTKIRISEERSGLTKGSRALWGKVRLWTFYKVFQCSFKGREETKKKWQVKQVRGWI